MAAAKSPPVPSLAGPASPNPLHALVEASLAMRPVATFGATATSAASTPSLTPTDSPDLQRSASAGATIGGGGDTKTTPTTTPSAKPLVASAPVPTFTLAAHPTSPTHHQHFAPAQLTAAALMPPPPPKLPPGVIASGTSASTAPAAPSTPTAKTAPTPHAAGPPTNQREAAAVQAFSKLWLERSELQCVWPGLWITNFFGARKLQAMKERKITHVLICARELQPIHPSHFVYKQLPIDDSPGHNIAQFFRAAFDFIDSALAPNGQGQAQGQCLIHCAAGASRSASILIAYVMCRHRLPFQAVLEKTRAIRSAINPNAGFVKQLLDLQHNAFQLK